MQLLFLAMDVHSLDFGEHAEELKLFIEML